MMVSNIDKRYQVLPRKLVNKGLCLCIYDNIYVVVNFLFQVIFVFLLFLGMVIYADEVETKEK